MLTHVFARIQPTLTVMKDSFAIQKQREPLKKTLVCESTILMM